uniref:ZP domain-containing protein n=1 Tax=Plectus sambesii TaxID=2011161 RepID=A0A914VHY9_9BILA
MCQFSALLLEVLSIAIDNGLVAAPEIQCGSRTVAVEFLVRRPFLGRLFVKGFSDDATCQGRRRRVDGVGIEIDLSSCGMQRIRSANPAGVFISAVFVLSFHPKFITSVDKAYRIQCFYMEASKQVTAQLEVSMLPTIMASVSMAMPQCRYELLEGGLHGPPVHFGKVGQAVFHKWSCQAEDKEMFCMVVHSCVVNDGRGDVVEVIDGDGCSLDPFLIGDLEYLDGLTAAKESHVFKYADRAVVYFTCQLAVTVKEPEKTCKRPTCGLYGHGKKRMRRMLSQNKRVANIDVSTSELQLVDQLDDYDNLRRKTEPVVELMRPPEHETDANRLPFESVPSSDLYCVDSVGAIVVMSAVTVLCLSSVTIAFYSLYARSAPVYSYNF